MGVSIVGPRMVTNFWSMNAKPVLYAAKMFLHQFVKGTLKRYCEIWLIKILCFSYFLDEWKWENRGIWSFSKWRFLEGPIVSSGTQNKRRPEMFWSRNWIHKALSLLFKWKKIISPAKGKYGSAPKIGVTDVCHFVFFTVCFRMDRKFVSRSRRRVLALQHRGFTRKFHYWAQPLWKEHLNTS